MGAIHSRSAKQVKELGRDEYYSYNLYFGLNLGGRRNCPLHVPLAKMSTIIYTFINGFVGGVTLTFFVAHLLRPGR